MKFFFPDKITIIIIMEKNLIVSVILILLTVTIQKGYAQNQEKWIAAESSKEINNPVSVKKEVLQQKMELKCLRNFV